jgi:CheY-like chemotaxis protein
MLTQKKLALQPKKILIVDDELSIRRILEKRFQLFGFQTAIAANGQDAWTTCTWSGGGLKAGHDLVMLQHVEMVI